MKTRVKQSLAWMLALLLTLGVWAASGVSLSTVSAAAGDSYNYTTLEDGTLSITGYTGSEANLTIPAELDGVAVTSISENAFQSKTGIVSVTIPEGITQIGARAFYDCTQLGNIDIPSTLESVAANSFENTAYFNNAGNWNGSCLYLEDVLLCSVPSQSAQLFVEYGTRVIASAALAFNGNLTTINLPDTVEIMGDGAFLGCTSLTSILLPQGLQTVSEAAFAYCESLKEVTFSDSVTEIAAGAFGFCTSLEELVLPPSLRVIREQAFLGDTSLRTVVLSPNLEFVELLAFDSCDNVTLYGVEGSYGQQYANNNGIPFTAIAPGLPFIDIAPSGVYYTDAVQYVYENGLMTGMNATTFGPSQTLSRAQFAVILYRMAGSPSVAGMDNPFADNQQGMFYHDAVIWCNNVGIITGYYNADGSFTGRFGPSDRITREQLATMLYRYANYAEMDTSASISLDDFGDGSRVSAFAAQALQWAAAEGIVSGRQTDPPTIAPQDSASRADTAVMLQRFLV